MIEYQEGYHSYYVYIITNGNRSVLYIGMTNNLGRRLQEHQDSATRKEKTFAARYNAVHLIYYEKFTWIQFAILREKELKGWLRKKKLALILSFNREMGFLEDGFLGNGLG